MAFAILLYRDFDDAGAALRYARRRFAAPRVADDEAVRAGLELGAEALCVEPVDADHQVEAIGEAFDRTGGYAQQSGGLAAANLRADGRRQQAVPSGSAGGLEQKISGRQSTGATAAHDGDRETCCFGHGNTIAVNEPCLYELGAMETRAIMCIYSYISISVLIYSIRAP